MHREEGSFYFKDEAKLSPSLWSVFIHPTLCGALITPRSLISPHSLQCLSSLMAAIRANTKLPPFYFTLCTTLKAARMDPRAFTHTLDGGWKKREEGENPRRRLLTLFSFIFQVSKYFHLEEENEEEEGGCCCMRYMASSDLGERKPEKICQGNKK